jgi:hypothetical protein
VTSAGDATVELTGPIAASAPGSPATSSKAHHDSPSISLELIDDHSDKAHRVGSATVTGGATIELGPTLGDDGGATIELPAKQRTVALGADRTIDLSATVDPGTALDDDQLGMTWGARATHTLRQDQTIELDSTDLSGSNAGRGTHRIGETVSGFRSTLPIKARSLRDSRAVDPQPGSDVPTTLVPIRDTPDYELLELLGQGGMGVVYAAKQSSIARTVAVKMLKTKTKPGTIAGSSVGDADQRDKFIAEAVITGELEHPNIVPIYDLGANDEGALFYSMKRVKGTPWDEVIRQKQLNENLAILMRVADAVAFAHANGVIHRDLKPENVMLGDFGEVLVMDWGLARVTPEFRSADSVYQADNLGGTPAYMAPEMARGPAESIDARSDVYLLGAILYEVIGGKPPHTGKDVMACLMAAATNKIQPIEYDGDLLEIALRAMATDPADRHPTVKELQAAIAEHQAHAESLLLSDNSQGLLERAVASNDYETYSRALHGFEEALLLWAGNGRARVGAQEARLAYARGAFDKGDYDLADSLLAGVKDDPDDPSDDARVAEAQELRQKIAVARAEREARQARLKNAKRLATALLLGIVAVASVSYFAVRRQYGIAIAERKTAVEQRAKAEANEARANRAKEEEAKQKVIAEQKRQEADEQRAKAQASEQLAKENEAAAVAARSVAEQARQAEAYAAYVARIGLAASKVQENGFREALALLSTCPPELRDWEWGRLRYLCGLSERVLDLGSPVDAVAYSPDGARVAAADWGGRITLFDASTGEQVWNADPRAEASAPLYAHAVAFSHDGKQIASGWSDNRVRVLDAATGRVEATLEGHTESVLTVAFATDGQRIASGGYDDSVIIWDANSGKAEETLRGHNWWVWAVAFAPDGQSLASASQDGTVVVWRQADGGFERATAFTGHQGPVYAVAYAPGGATVASAGEDGVVRLWSPLDTKPADLKRRVEGLPDPPAEHRELASQGAPLRTVAYSADGGRLVSGSNDNTLRIWNLASGESVALRGHGGRVRGVAYAPSGAQVASAAQDGQVRLWDVAGYTESRVLHTRALDGHDDAVLSARFSPDGERVVTASRDRTARVWDAATGETLATLREGHRFLASSAVWFDNGRSLATAAGDNTVRLWDVGDGVERHALEGTGRSAALAIDSQGTLLVTDGPTGVVRLWNPSTGEHLLDLDQHEADVTALAVADRGEVFASGDERGRIVLWRRNAGGWSVAAKLEGHSRQITGLRFTTGGARLVSSSGDRTVGQWDVASGRELRELVLKHPEWVAALDVSDNGRYALTACDDGVARVWRLADAREVARWSPPASDDREPTVTTSVDLAPGDGGNLVALLATAATGRVDRWVIEPDAAPSEPQMLVELAGAGALWSARFADDADTVVTIGGNDARVWRVAADRLSAPPVARPVVRLSPHGAVADAAFSPDGLLIATGSWDHSAKLWDAATGRPVRKLDGGHTGFVNALAFSPDGAELATAGDDGVVRFWSVDSGELAERRLAGHSGRVLAVVYSRDGRRLLTVASDKTARLWDSASGDELRRFVGHEWGLLDGALSPDGTRVATASEDNTARLWDAETGEELFALRGHSAAVAAVTFSPDGRRVLTGGEDNVAKVWDAATGKEVLTLAGHTAEVTSASFSPDGGAALTGSRDGAAIVWPAAPWR